MGDKYQSIVVKGAVFSAVAMLVVSNVYAYEQGKGTVATIASEDKVIKSDVIASDDPKERIKGNFNRSGNPVRIIWYGNPNDNDGKVPQTAANNQGQIIGKVSAVGQATSNTEDRRGAISIDGIANGIDALGWSAPANPNDVIFKLDSVENGGSIEAEAHLQGGEAETHGDINSYGSGNGISIIGLADFGKHNAAVGADGIADGYSGATGVSRSRSVSRSAVSRVATPSSPALDKADFEGKTVEVSLQTVHNSGQINAKIDARASQTAQPHTASHKPQFYSVTSSASGNAISASSYVNTIDKYTFSEGKNNFARLGNVNNRGYLVGQAHLLGGKNTTQTGTIATNSGNGLSAFAKTGRFAKNRTESSVGNIENSGEISGLLEQVSGNNSNYQGFHLYSNAYAYGSGNAISVTTESSNGQNRYVSNATLGNVKNTGKMLGVASVQAGSGMGELMAEAYSSGNGLSTYAKGNSGQLSMIGNVINNGVISGQITVKSGKSDLTAKDKAFIPEIIQPKTASSSNAFGNSLNSWLAPSSPSANRGSTSSRLSPETCKWLAPNTPGCEVEEKPATSHAQATVQTGAAAHSSGNGISVWSYGESSENGTQNSRLGNIDNTGVISGYAKVWQGFSQGDYARVDYRNNGAGIAINASTDANITNLGLISGNHSALLARGKIDTGWSTRNPEYRSGFKGNIHNYGILAGRMIVGGYELSHSSAQYYRYFETKNDNKVKNGGLYITLDKNGYIENVTAGNDLKSIERDGKTYEVINVPILAGNKDSEKLTTGAESFENKIINGVGLANGALYAKHNATLKNTIVNGYKTALKMADNAEVTLVGSTLNANGFNVNQTENTFAVLGDNGVNKLRFSNTIINGDIALNAGNDELTIEDAHSKFNGRTIDLGEGQDTLTLGQPNSSGNLPINVGYTILNAENLVINQESVLLANANVRGTDHIILNQDLHYQVLSPEQHALFDRQRYNKIALNGVGKFIVNMPKAESEYEINFGGFQLDPDNIHFATNNILQSAVFKDGKLLIQPKVVITAEEAKKQADELNNAQEDLDKLKQQLAQAEQKETEQANLAEQSQAKQQAEIDKLKDQLAKAEQSQAKQQEALEQLRQQLAQTNAQEDLDKLKQQLAQAEQKETEQANLAEQSQAKQQAEIDKLKDQLAKAEQSQAKQQETLEQLRQQLAQTQQAFAQTKQDLAKTIQQLEQAKQADQKTALSENTAQNLLDLQQKIAELERIVESKKAEADNQFQTPYRDVYHSYIASWKATGINPLLQSSQTDSHSAEQANNAINHYFAETVEHNIYGAVAHQLHQNLAQQRRELLAMTKRLKEKAWYVAAKGIYHTSDYQQTAKKATTAGSMVAISYGVNDNLTLGVHFAQDKGKIKGNHSLLKGSGHSVGLYINQAFNQFTFTSGAIYAQHSLNGKRYITNGYDSHQFDANVKAAATSVYAQVKYGLPLSEQWQFEPKLRMAYTHLNQKAINESGIAGLHIDALNTHYLETVVGQDLVGTFSTHNGKAQIRVGADYSLMAGGKDLQGRFSNGTNFTIYSEPHHHIAHIGGGIGYEWHNGVELKINAQKSLGKNHQTSANIMFGYTFK